LTMVTRNICAAASIFSSSSSSSKLLPSPI
jgi:hypothetical protein